MSAPLSGPNAQAITDVLSQIGLSGSGATADQWRQQMDINTSIATHLQTIAAAVTAAKQRASDALSDYTAAAPTAAEIDAVQQELLAATQEDDTRHPERLKKAEDKLGELLARKQRAEDKFGKDTQDNTDQLAADRKSADGELSPQARAKLAQLLGSMTAMPASPMGGGAPAAAPAGGAPSAGGRPVSGFSPSSSVSDSSDMGPVGSSGGGEEPGLTHTTTDLGAVASAPTLTNVTSGSPIGSEATPVATAGAQSAAGGSPAAGGFMPPMAPGMGMGGAGRNQGTGREGEGRTGSKLDRDEVLNGDDLLSRSVKGRL